jgi:hypothetical protein
MWFSGDTAPSRSRLGWMVAARMGEVKLPHIEALPRTFAVAVSCQNA